MSRARKNRYEYASSVNVRSVKRDIRYLDIVLLFDRLRNSKEETYRKTKGPTSWSFGFSLNCRKASVLVTLNMYNLVNRTTPGFCQYWKEIEPFHRRSCCKNSTVQNCRYYYTTLTRFLSTRGCNSRDSARTSTSAFHFGQFIVMFLREMIVCRLEEKR